MPYKDPEERRAYQAAYRAAHHEEKLAHDAAYYAAHREQLLAYQAAYRAAHHKEKRAYQAAYYAAHREERRTKIAAYAAAHREKKRAYNAAWHAAHRGESWAYEAARRANDPAYKLAYALRGRLTRAIKGNYKAGSAVRDLGCTIAEFKAFIEVQFTPWQTWENWGTRWHLDHIEPLASFDLSDPEQFRQAMHYTNYQPLDIADNLAKGAKRGVGRQLW
jgi:hypothetical protein